MQTGESRTNEKEIAKQLDASGTNNTLADSLKSWATAWKDLASIVGTFVSCIGLLIAMAVALVHIQRYGDDREKDLQRDRHSILNNLANTESRYRMLDPKKLGQYNYAKDLTENLKLAATTYVTLARAAIDVGEPEAAEVYLNKAVKDVNESQDAEALKARDRAEIAKTRVLKGEIEGLRDLEVAKKMIKKHPSVAQFRTLHDVILWQAQFSAKNDNLQATETYLMELSNMASSFAFPKGKVQIIIREAYESCLAILACQSNNDPMLEVPIEYEVFYEAKWERVIDIARRNVPCSTLPPTMMWLPETPTPFDERGPNDAASQSIIEVP